MIVMAVQKDTCFPALLWLLESTTLLVTVLFEILAFTPDDSALPLLPNPYIQGNCSSINNLPLYIDFLLVCGVTFSTVCLLLYDQLTLLISYDGSVRFLSSIWLFLTEKSEGKFIIIIKSIAQANIDPFSLPSSRVCGGWGVHGMLEQRFCTPNLSSLFNLVRDGYFCTLPGELLLLGRLAIIFMNANSGIADGADGRNSSYYLFVLHPFSAAEDNTVT